MKLKYTVILCYQLESNQLTWSYSGFGNWEYSQSHVLVESEVWVKEEAKVYAWLVLFFCSSFYSNCLISFSFYNLPVKNFRSFKSNCVSLSNAFTLVSPLRVGRYPSLIEKEAKTPERLSDLP